MSYMSTTTLQLSSAMPEFRLNGTDDKIYDSTTYSGFNAMLIIFSCNHCPYVQAYENRMKMIQEDYGKDKLLVFAINSNDDSQYPDDSFESMKIRSKEKAFNFPYLRDEDQSIAKAFGATHTPEIFLFNKEKKLVFHGKIDDNWQDESSVKNSYLRNAIDEMLNGETISVPETFTIGCTIKWKTN